MRPGEKCLWGGWKGGAKHSRSRRAPWDLGGFKQKSDAIPLTADFKWLPLAAVLRTDCVGRRLCRRPEGGGGVLGLCGSVGGGKCGVLEEPARRGWGDLREDCLWTVRWELSRTLRVWA